MVKSNVRFLAWLLCLSFCILRVAKSDEPEGYLVGLGLTGVDCVALEGLIYYAGKRQRVALAYRNSRAQIAALEEAIASLDAQIAADRTRRDAIVAALQQREAMSRDAKPAADQLAWAVEAAYRGAINANQRLLEGGSVESFQTIRSQEEAL